MPLLSVSQLFSNIMLDDFQLQHVSFTQDAFQNTAIIGETGAGKSTLLKMIAGFIQPSKGEIIFDKLKILGPDFQLVAGTKGIAYLSQHFELRHNYKMKDLLAIDNECTELLSNEIMNLCKVQHLLQRNSKQLSGGEKQRMALAKLLLAKPKLLILDEPYSNLDVSNKKELKLVIANVCKRFEMSCILSSHDPIDVLPWAQQIIVLQDGQIVQHGEPATIYYHPVNAYTASLLGHYVILDKVIQNAFHLPSSVNFLILRSENIEISNNQNKGLEAMIVDTRFCGFYFETDIEFAQISFTIFCQQQFHKGDIVYLNMHR